ncbi:metallophosphoesterase [soil metagenome]
MRLKDWALLAGAASGAMFTYGMLFESNRLVAERHLLRLPLWPSRLDGYRIAVLSDLHMRGIWSLRLTKRAVLMALEAEPNFIVLPGDFVDFWRDDSVEMLSEALAPLAVMKGNAVAVPGNHDYFFNRSPEALRSVLDPLGIPLLRNEVLVRDGVSWVGIDSAIDEHCDPVRTMAQLTAGPAISVWHEPDLIRKLPVGCALQISGHSHGGQFRFPFGITPMHSHLGKEFDEGFYPETPTPLYVSRGVGTTGPPSRFLCPPEVSILTLSAG